MNTVPRSFRLLAPFALLLIALPLFAACSGGDESDPAPEVLGRQLAARWLDVLTEQDRDKISDFMAPNFIVARADGTRLDKAQFLENPAKVNKYTIGETILARREGDLLTVHWTVSVDEIIDGKTVPTAPAPRLSVFQKIDGEWKLLAHSNFNAPAR